MELDTFDLIYEEVGSFIDNIEQTFGYNKNSIKIEVSVDIYLNLISEAKQNRRFINTNPANLILGYRNYDVNIIINKQLKENTYTIEYYLTKEVK